jgi:ATP-binding cassette subfamily B (MDR/TAP) protein 7
MNKEKSRTSVFVAHRLRTISDSDQILVLKEGHVAETGWSIDCSWAKIELARHANSNEKNELTIPKLCINAALLLACLANSILAQEQSMDQDIDLEQDQGEDVPPKGDMMVSIPGGMCW